MFPLHHRLRADTHSPGGLAAAHLANQHRQHHPQLVLGCGLRSPRPRHHILQTASQHRELGTPAERVRVYEKMGTGIWTFNGTFRLVDAWREESNVRLVSNFRLEVDPDATPVVDEREPRLEQNRLIPTDVKLAVWKRTKANVSCAEAAATFHFDHIIPYSRGGSSLVARNIQLMCARHNLAKHDKIQ